MKALKLAPMRLPVFITDDKGRIEQAPDVDAFLLTPEVAIHRSIDLKGWSVVHVPTLWALFLHINTKENAINLADMFSKLSGIESLTPENVAAFVAKNSDKVRQMKNFERANQWK